MEVKAGYKQTEVGVIPEDWEVKTMDSLTSLMTNGFVGTATSAYVDSEDGVLYVQGYNVQENGFNFHGIKRVSKWFHSRNQKSRLRSGDLLTIQTGDIGVTTVVPPELAGANCHALVISRFDERSSDPRFYCQYFNSERGRSKFKEIETGSTMKHLNVGDMKLLLLPSPRVEEQRAIAAALSDVDALLGGLDRLIAKKRDLKQAAMQALLSPPATEGMENGKWKMENGDSGNSQFSTLNSQLNRRLPGFSGAWEVKRLGDVIHLIRGGIYGDEKPRAGLSASSVATTAHIEMDDTWNNKEMPVRYFTAEKLRDYATAEGDLIVVKSSGSAASIQSGKLGFIDTERAGKFVFSNFLMLLRPTGVLPRFLYFYLCSHNVKKLLPTLVEASTYPNIRLGDYLDVQIPIPPLPEQTAIAAVLSDMDAELAALEARRDKTRDLKQAMMQELLTGRTRLV